MNSLEGLSVSGKKAIVALMIISALVLGAAAQTVAPNQQGKMYGDPRFSR